MLEKYITDGMQPQAAERAATFDTKIADVLRGAVGGTKFGGVLDIDVRDPEQEKFILKQKNRFNNKVFYDPYEDNYKYLVIQNGQVVFDEFKTIPEIKFPDFTATPPEKTKFFTSLNFAVTTDSNSSRLLGARTTRAILFAE